MGYPRRLLTEDERLIYELRPHWKRLVAPAVMAPILVFAVAFGIAKIPHGYLQNPVRIGIGAVGALLFLAYSVVPFLRWRTTLFVLTNRRIVMRSGVIARHGRDIPIFRINDVTFQHTVAERLLGAGTLIVESAGERGQVTLTDIPRVEEVQREIYRLIEAEARADRADRPDRGAPPPSG